MDRATIYWALTKFEALRFLLSFWSKHGQHPPAFHLGHIFQHTRLGQPFGEFQQQQLTPILKLNGPSLELNIGLYLIAFLQEFNRMFGLEIKIVVIGVGCESDLFHLGGLALGLHLLLFFLLIVQKLIVVNDLANRRINIGRDLHQIEPLFL